MAGAFGKSLPKKDAVAKVTGQAQYVDDLFFADMLFAKVLRSPYPHARIHSVDVESAKEIPGVKAVLTGNDGPEKAVSFMLSSKWQDKMLFAREKVRYVGEEVTVVAGVSLEVCAKALELIRVEYEVLPAASSVEAALADHAPLVHDEMKTNVADCYTREEGDVSGGLAQADLVIEGTYNIPAINANALEPHGVVARFVEERLDIWTSTQTPYYVKKDLAQVLDLSMANICVHEVVVGGGFGAKTRVGELDLICVLLAKTTGRPVKLVFSREEVISVTRSRYPHRIELKTGVRKDGQIVAWDAKITLDNGAYNCLGHLFGNIEGSRLASLYPAPTRVKAIPVYTNNPPGGQVRAYGNAQITFAIESQMDEIACKLGLDRLDLRLKNSVRVGQETPWGWRVVSCGLQECLEKAGRQMSGSQKAPLSGTGLAAMTHRCSGGKEDYSAAFVKITEGEAVVFSGATDIGQGSTTILCQIAAQVLGLDYNNVKAITMDTDLTPLDMGSRANRVTFMAGSAVKAAAEDARRQLINLASQLLGLPPDKLELENGQVYDLDDPAKSIGVRELTTSNEPKGGSAVLGKGCCQNPVEQGRETYVYGSQCVEVTVDDETGQISVLKVTAAHDVGKAINPVLVEGQIEGGISQGLGMGLFEEVVRQSGVTLNDNFLDYKLPTSLDVPVIETIIVESQDPYGPLGAKGVGEPVIVPTAPAIANAVYDAIGIRIADLPLTAEKVLRAIRLQQVKT